MKLVRPKLATPVIVVVVLVQCQALVPKVGVLLWPFIDYPVYTPSYPEGPITADRVRIHWTTEDGRTGTIDEDAWRHMGMGTVLFNMRYRNPMSKGNGDSEKAQKLGRLLEEAIVGSRVARLETVVEYWHIDGEGLRRGETRRIVYDLQETGA